jgi:hypothetical protein
MPELNPPVITARELLDIENPMLMANVPSGPDLWHEFARSYKEAGDSLASLVMTGEGKYRILALPMMFACRHYVELHLKALLIAAGQLLDDPQTVPPKHYLQVLWKRVRALLLRIDGNDPTDPWLLRADDIVAQLDGLDPNSFAFRYPVDVFGVASLPSGLEVDASVVSGVVAELHLLLDGASTQIDVYMDTTLEARYDGWWVTCCLTGVAADAGAMERAKALATLVSTARSYWSRRS